MGFHISTWATYYIQSDRRTANQRRASATARERSRRRCLHLSHRPLEFGQISTHQARQANIKVVISASLLLLRNLIKSLDFIHSSGFLQRRFSFLDRQSFANISQPEICDRIRARCPETGAPHAVALSMVASDLQVV